MPAILLGLLLLSTVANARQDQLAIAPPMGWMTWNYFGENINENDLREMGDALVRSKMALQRRRHVCSGTGKDRDQG